MTVQDLELFWRGGVSVGYVQGRNRVITEWYLVTLNVKETTTGIGPWRTERTLRRSLHSRDT